MLNTDNPEQLKNLQMNDRTYVLFVRPVQIKPPISYTSETSTDCAHTSCASEMSSNWVSCQLFIRDQPRLMTGPDISYVYTTPLSKVISKHPDVKFHFYADDTQLFIHLKHKNAKIAFDRLGKCLEDVKLWLCANKLKLNADKTDFILFGAKSQQEKFNPFFPVNILGESLIPSDAVKNWVSGLTQTFPSPNMLKMYVNYVSSR